MKNIVFFFLLIAFVQIAQAQNFKRVFKGTVTDSATGLPMKDVTVSFYKAQDTSLVNFCFTTPNGNYNMDLKIRDSLLVIISFMGYNDKVLKIAEAAWSWSFDEQKIKLSKAPFQLKEVKVSAGLIRMKGDTIEINAARIKVLPNSDVSQMFKKIPGFEVNKNGTIKVNGSEVSKIMVDGSDFFGNNPELVSKNLRADMIDKVQVYDDKDESGAVLPDNTKSINLKLKKGKQIGFFGDAIAGYGNNNRYESGLRINSFKNDRKWSFITNSNNINDKGFDFGFKNWHGGSWAQRSGSLSRYVHYNSKQDDANSKGNINQKTSSAFSFFNEYSRKRKLSFNLGYKNNQFITQTISEIQNPINDSVFQKTFSTSNLNGKANELSADIKYTKEIDSVGNWGTGINIAMNKYFQNYESQNKINLNDFVVNNGVNNYDKNINQQTAGFYFSYLRRNRKNKKLSIAVDEKSNINQSAITSYQFSKGVKSDFNFKNNNALGGNEHLLQITGNVPLIKKFRLGLTTDAYTMQNNNVTNVINASNFLAQDFSQLYNNKIDSLSINFYNSALQLSAKAFLSWLSKDDEFKAGATYLDLTLHNQNLTLNEKIIKHYNSVLPFISYSSWKRSVGYIRFNLEKAVDFPSFTHLMPLQNLTNPWMRLLGNPNLIPFEQYQLSAMFSKSKYKLFKSIWTNFTINQSDNYLCYVNTIDSKGISYRTPINLTGYFNESINLNTEYSISKKIDIDANISQRYTIVPELFNNQKKYGKNATLYASIGAEMNASEKIEFDASVSYSISNYKNNLNPTVNYKQAIPGFDGNIKVNFWKGNETNLDVEISDNRSLPSIGKVVSIVNLYFQQALDEQEKYHLKLTCYDLLKQNVNITRSVNGNYVNLIQNNLLQQFFMLSLIYKMKGKNTESGGSVY